MFDVNGKTWIAPSETVDIEQGKEKAAEYATLNGSLFGGLASAICDKWTSCSTGTKFVGLNTTPIRNPVGRRWHAPA